MFVGTRCVEYWRYVAAGPVDMWPRMKGPVCEPPDVSAFPSNET